MVSEDSTHAMLSKLMSRRESVLPAAAADVLRSFCLRVSIVAAVRCEQKVKCKKQSVSRWG
jgi:hypothetical protein